MELIGLRLLLVEDDPDSREVLALLLEDLGAEVASAPSVRVAREWLETRTPDAILSDLSMPGEDGYALIRHVRSTEATRRVPAIAITAYPGNYHRRQALDAGFQEYVTKPVELTGLATMIHRLVARVETGASAASR
jgi:CheY-like chemotaxis protein